ASMSHELRTPLNAVIGYSQLLLDDADDDGDEALSRDVQKIHTAGAQLLGLVDDILDFSRIEAGKMPVQAQPDSLSHGVGALIADLQTAGLERNYSIEVALPKDDVELRLDWQALGKAIGHLVNGVTTEGPGGLVRMDVSHEPTGNLVIRVVDPAGQAGATDDASLFDAFAAASDASATKYGGAGISLALSLKFAQLIGGDVTATRGADSRRVFTLTVPADAEPDTLRAAA
ncbi:MAG: HAMP domain-containing histidine kinase, partial [Caulobacteraceae bacterium]